MIQSALLVRWYKNDGESIIAGEAICEIETDGASADVSAPQSGILRQLMREGETVRMGDEVAKIERREGSE